MESTERTAEAAEEAPAASGAGTPSASASTAPVLVAKGLYVGGIESLKHIDALRITHVVTVLNGGDDGDNTDGDNTDGDNDGAPTPTRPPRLVPAERPSDGYPIVSWRVPVDDLEDADLLTHLPAAVQFLQAALRQPTARVLVHCAQGVSRSAAVAAALYMSARRLKQSSEALALMRSGARPPGAADHLRPNDGFLAQLDLFGEMGWQVDEACAAYRAYRAERAAAAWLEGGGGGGAVGSAVGAGFFARLPSWAGEEEEGEEEAEKEGGVGGPKDKEQAAAAPPPPPPTTATMPATLYRCRRCRRLLATSHNEVPADWVRGKRTFGRMGRHTAAFEAALAAAEAEAKAEQQYQQHYQQQQSEEGAGPSPAAAASATASTVAFVEPMRWMRAQVLGGDGSGKLYCPREGCPQRVGSFAWSGISSPSGAWVTPAFALHTSRVDAVVASSAGGGGGAEAAGPAPTLAGAPMIRAPVLLPSGAAGIRVPVLLGREARPPVVPVSRRAGRGGGSTGGGAGGGDGAAAAAAPAGS